MIDDWRIEHEKRKALERQVTQLQRKITGLTRQLAAAEHQVRDLQTVLNRRDRVIAELRSR